MAGAGGLHDAPVGRARETVPVLRERAAIPDRTRTIPRGVHRGRAGDALFVHRRALQSNPTTTLTRSGRIGLSSEGVWSHAGS